MCVEKYTSHSFQSVIKHLLFTRQELQNEKRYESRSYMGWI